jgi:hypothetical protein
MPELRLGDVIDDYCVKCRRLTNHSIVSLMSGAAAKVRCRTCYSDHDFRNEQAPPTKKELARQKELYAAVLAGVAPAAAAAGADPIGGDPGHQPPPGPDPDPAPIDDPPGDVPPGPAVDPPADGMAAKRKK